MLLGEQWVHDWCGLKIMDVVREDKICDAT